MQGNYAGMGVSAVVNGKTYFAGNEKLMAEVGVDFKETSLVGTAIYLCSEEEFFRRYCFLLMLLKQTVRKPLQI